MAVLILKCCYNWCLPSYRASKANHGLQVCAVQSAARECCLSFFFFGWFGFVILMLFVLVIFLEFAKAIHCLH